MVKKSAIAAFITKCQEQRWAPSTVVSQLSDFCAGDEADLHENCQPLIDGQVAHPSDLQTAEEAQAVATVG